MATADGGNDGGPRDWKKRESLGSALTQVGVVAVLLAAAVYFWVQRGKVREAVNAHLRTARELAQRGNPEDTQAALKELEALFALDVNAYDAQVLAADLHASLWLEQHVVEEEGRTREHLARAETLEASNRERYGARVVRALVLLHEDKAQEASTSLEGLVAQGASSPRLWLALGRVRQARGDLLGARQAFAQATESAWRDSRYAAEYGEALLDEGLYTQAHEALRKALLANAGNVQARLTAALVRLYQQPEKVDDVLTTVREVSAREDTLTPGLKARLLAVRAELALARGVPEEAVHEADTALALVPDAHYALFARARALAARKDSGARAAFEKAVTVRHTAPLLYLDGARALLGAGDAAGSLALLDTYEATFRDVRVPAGEGKAVAALERDDRYWLSRGGVLEAVGRPDDALASYDKALTAHGLGFTRAQYAKGALLLARKDYGGARPLLEPLAPADGTGVLPEAYAALGDVLFASGDAPGGYQQYLRSVLVAKARGLGGERLKAQVEELGKRLNASGTPLTKDWASDSAKLLQTP